MPSTLDATTGAVRYTFTYTNGLLTTVTDFNSDALTITRNSQGLPTAITAPYGQPTTLATSNGPAGNFLTSVTDPAGQTVVLTTNLSTGQVTRLKDARGYQHVYAYAVGSRLRGFAVAGPRLMGDRWKPVMGRGIGVQALRNGLRRDGNMEAFGIAEETAPSFLREGRMVVPDYGRPGSR